MGSVPDLSLPIMFRSINLNAGLTEETTNGKPALVGCVVDTFDPTELEVRQFREPLALQNGIDVGGTWLGARRLAMSGTVSDRTRGQTYDRLAALEEIMVAQSGTFGYYPLTWQTITGDTSIASTKTINVIPGGLRYVINRDSYGQYDVPISIQWSVTFYAKRPVILDA